MEGRAHPGEPPQTPPTVRSLGLGQCWMQVWRWARLEQVQALSWHQRAVCVSLEVVLCDGEPRWVPYGDSGPPAGPTRAPGSETAALEPRSATCSLWGLGELCSSFFSKLLVCEVMKQWNHYKGRFMS